MANPLPTTIRYSLQPYTHGAVVGNLEWATESEPDWNSGDPTRRKTQTVLRGVILQGKETAYLLGHSSTRDITGKSVTIYGVKDAELERGEIIRIAV